MLPASDISEAIQWHEGMLLAPQHFQQWRARKPCCICHARGLPLLLGCTSCPHRSRTAGEWHSARHRVRGHHARRIARDAYPSGARRTGGGPRALCGGYTPAGAALSGRASPYPWLGASARRRGRYVSVDGAAMVDENTGEGDIPFPRLRPRCSLLLTATPPARYVHLPLACVCYQDEVFALTDFLPPTWSMPLHSPLGDMCTRIARRLREKAVALAEKVRARRPRWVHRCSSKPRIPCTIWWQPCLL